MKFHCIFAYSVDDQNFGPRYLGLMGNHGQWPEIAPVVFFQDGVPPGSLIFGR
jgi:hypothetical protein